jgi:small subunit ribosomal protein S6
MRYEILYLLPESKTADCETIGKVIETHITECGATLLKDSWEDRRKLAYPIKNSTKGIFVARRFEISKDEDALEKEIEPIQEITKRLRLMTDVLRFLIVSAENLPPLKEFSARKEEERLKHSQAPRHTDDKHAKRTERKSFNTTPLSSDPFSKKKLLNEEKKEEASSPEKTTPTKEKVADKDTKAIDEKLDEILNM